MAETGCSGSSQCPLSLPLTGFEGPEELTLSSTFQLYSQNYISTLFSTFPLLCMTKKNFLLSFFLYTIHPHCLPAVHTKFTNVVNQSVKETKDTLAESVKKGKISLHVQKSCTLKFCVTLSNYHYTILQLYLNCK